MIIDTHVHIGNILVFDMPPEDVLYSMDRYGIDFSLVSNVECAENDNNGNPIPQNLQKSQKKMIFTFYTMLLIKTLQENIS